ncbi:transglutaminase domain-containing protein [uncultured Tenacibaculum sp.]|uniref:transglutaminase domain-containing protein n=1 Tax=uncultured Tenacibaculum sp. TaxID=174713 RepID=UPI0026351448|nr:transglutaminase domain-containing protein [uncultured Tenacibaculum sp.]
MKQLLFFLFFTSFTLFAQDFSEVSEKVATYPKLISAENLAKNIARDFSSKENQLKAAFYWITKNIRYDLEEFYNPKNKRVSFRYRDEAERLQKIREIKDNIVRETLRSRKGVCEGYAQTLAKICSLLNIENEVIKGYIRNSSTEINRPRNSTNHAWNAVKINNQWRFIDATWAAGAIMNGKWQRSFNPYYYNIPKDKHFKTHFPESKLWQLRIGRMTLDDFYNQPIYASSFLNSTVKLVSPQKGILTSRNNEVKIKLGNIAANQHIMVGFMGYQFAIQPKIVRTNNITTLTINPPEEAQELFVLIDREVMLEFLIQ